MPSLAIGLKIMARRPECKAKATDLPCSWPCCLDTSISRSSFSIPTKTAAACGTVCATRSLGAFMEIERSSTYLASLMVGKRRSRRSHGQSMTRCKIAQEKVLPAMMAVTVSAASLGERFCPCSLPKQTCHGTAGAAGSGRGWGVWGGLACSAWAWWVARLPWLALELACRRLSGYHLLRSAGSSSRGPVRGRMQITNESLAS